MVANGLQICKRIIKNANNLKSACVLIDKDNILFLSLKQKPIAKNIMEITIKKCEKTNKVRFYSKKNQIYPIKISGNIAQFQCGSVILF
jgi:methylase of polypeptide subunit release factors